MSKKLTEGFRLYGSNNWMEGVSHALNAFDFKRDPRQLFKKIFVEGVGEKAIDAIEDDLITINTGYKAIDDHVIYEVFNDEKSVLTTLKKVNATQLQSSESLAGFSAGARLRVPPIGLELVESDENTDKYKTASGGLIVISKAVNTSSGKIGVEIDGITNAVEFNNPSGEFFFVSKDSIYFLTENYYGFTDSGTGVVKLNLGECRILKGDEIVAVSGMLFPINDTSSIISRALSTGGIIKTRATVLSKVFVGEDREELPHVYASSSTRAAPDFVKGARNSREEYLQFIKDGDDTIAVNITDNNAILGKIARLV